MDREDLDADQIQRVRALLESHGIEPTQQTLQALIQTAEQSYPNDPDRLEKAAQSLLGFFAGPRAFAKEREFTWERLIRWAFPWFSRN